ncbi:MAG: M24 family metallopeptidase, partial [Bauldia sp.]
TGTAIEKGAMVVVTAERWGIHLSCTRTAWLMDPGQDWRGRFEACRRVEAAMMRAARPGATLGDALRKGIEAYAREGFPKEWELHHQGGLAGYAPREVFARPGDFTEVAAGQLHAWNPTIRGAKSEDSFLVGEDGPEVVTVDPTWPSETVAAPGGSLERPAAVVL